MRPKTSAMCRRRIDATLLADDGLQSRQTLSDPVREMRSYLRHPSGLLTSFTSQIFSEIVANFRATQNKRIPIDF